jgi:DNA modification methylase
MKITERKINELIPAEYNPRQLSSEQAEQLKASLQRFGAVDPAIINTHPERKNIIVGGHQRLKTAQSLGWETFPCVEVELDRDKERELNIRLNKNTGGWDYDALANYFEVEELTDWGFSDEELFGNIEADKENTEDDVSEAHKKLSDIFVVPPFSVLDTRQGYWNDRKKHWKTIIGDDGESREGTLSESELMSGINNGVSILDPVLAEIANRWFTPDNANTFDCFAGDTVFGYVSSYLGHNFTGIELRKEQADLNNQRCKGLKAKYYCDDGRNVCNYLEPNSQDLLFSCPPYFDLEVYSDLENDASNQKDYISFIKILETAFTNAISCLKENRFAFIVVGDLRNKNGAYYNFPQTIKDIFLAAGCVLYNELVLVEPLGTLPQRVGRYMGTRKIGKCHQNILVFYKGDIKEIKNNFNKIEINAIEDL